MSGMLVNVTFVVADDSRDVYILFKQRLHIKPSPNAQQNKTRWMKSLLQQFHYYSVSCFEAHAASTDDPNLVEVQSVFGVVSCQHRYLL